MILVGISLDVTLENWSIGEKRPDFNMQQDRTEQRLMSPMIKNIQCCEGGPPSLPVCVHLSQMFGVIIIK